MEAFVAIVALGLALLFKPAPAPDRVVLLPDQDGGVGRVVVQTASGTQEIATAYGAVNIDAAGAITPYQESRESIRARHADLLAARPALPRSYLLYFKTGSDDLTQESRQTLEALLNDARQRVAAEIRVIGHTDRVGSEADNAALSLQRAQVVARQLGEQAGLHPKSLEIVGRGESQALVPTPDGVDEPRNRRVEVSIR